MKAPLRAIFIAVLISIVACSVVFAATVEAQRGIEVIASLTGKR